MKKIFLITLLCLLLQPAFSQALSVQSGQEVIPLTIEAGRDHAFFLIVNSPDREVLTSSSLWVMIEGNNSYRLPSGGTVFLRINVTVPESETIGEQKIPITYGAATLSTLLITSTLQIEEIRALQAIANVSEEISVLRSQLTSDISSKLKNTIDGIQSQVNSIKSELTSSIQDVKNYQKNVGSLESDKNSLQTKIQNLTTELTSLQNKTRNLQTEKEQLELTGNSLRGESPLLFVLGLLIGAGGIFLFYRKLHKYL